VRVQRSARGQPSSAATDSGHVYIRARRDLQSEYRLRMVVDGRENSERSYSKRS
jgi:hypothetical protein